MYGCHNHQPYVQTYPGMDVSWPIYGERAENIRYIRTFGQQSCQYRLTELGRQDKKCEGCTHRNINEF